MGFRGFHGSGLSGFRVGVSGFLGLRIRGLGFRSSGYWGRGFGFTVSRFEVSCSGFVGSRFRGSGFYIQGSGFREEVFVDDIYFARDAVFAYDIYFARDAVFTAEFLIGREEVCGDDISFARDAVFAAEILIGREVVSGISSSWFRVRGFGFVVSRFEVSCSGFEVFGGPRFRVSGSVFRGFSIGYRFRGFAVLGFGFRDFAVPGFGVLVSRFCGSGCRVRGFRLGVSGSLFRVSRFRVRVLRFLEGSRFGVSG